MADEDTDRGMTKVSRPVHAASRTGGPRPIAALVPGIARVAFGGRSPGIAQLLEAWVGIVGPTLADITVPRRMARGTLTIGCSGPAAMELQHLSGELIGRINQYLGSPVVGQLRLVQDLPARTPPRSRPQVDPAASIAAAEAVAHLPEGPLRTALAALGQAVLSESPSRLGYQPRTRY
jgi:hypothetical protein